MSGESVVDVVTTQGDSTPTVEVGILDSDGVLVDLVAGSYTCSVIVDGQSIDRAVTALNVANTRFLVSLTPAETAPLAVGGYKMSAIIVQGSTFKRTTKIDLTIEEAYVG